MKENIKEFFVRFKKVFLAGAIGVLAVALIAVVAAKSTQGTKLANQAVNTSATASVNFIMPVENGEIIKDFSNTALKFNSTLKQWESHKAVDIRGNQNSNVLAVSDGVVLSIKTNYLTGTVVIIKHSDSLQTVYGSLAEDVLVKEGDRVKQGQVIGTISDSAKNESADGPHLHFEVLLNGIKTDPNLYLITSEK